MNKPGFKESAESLLRELPSVVGAFVREDAYGNPREIHILIQPGPEPRHFARDVRDLLEERFGVEVDQRIISIAQLARDAAAEVTPQPAGPESAPRAAAVTRPVRLRFLGCQSRVAGGRVFVRVELERDDVMFAGDAEEMESGGGRIRAGAMAALAAATAACEGRARVDFTAATVVRGTGRSYALVSAAATSALFGRRPLLLAGAQVLDDEPETAGALAALKSANRVLSRLLEPDAAEPVRRPTPR